MTEWDAVFKKVIASMGREQRMRLFLRCLGALVGIGGMLILVLAAGWPTCLAVVLMIYGNNLERKGEN